MVWYFVVAGILLFIFICFIFFAGMEGELDGMSFKEFSGWTVIFLAGIAIWPLILPLALVAFLGYGTWSAAGIVRDLLRRDK